MSVLHLVGYIETSARRFPERPAATDQDGTALTYQEIDDRASRIAGFFLDRDVRRGDRVALALPRPPPR